MRPSGRPAVTLTPASAVAFAVAGRQPADAREWISIDLTGFPEAGRRGYLVATEPVGQTGRARELAAHARIVLLDELRRLRKSPPDVALGRAFAAANAAIFEQIRASSISGGDDGLLVGASAVIFEGHAATLAQVPPGQLIVVEDGLVYAVPKLESWFPHFAGGDSNGTRPEPLGFASYTAPLIAQTELSAGDTVIASTARTGQAFAEEVVSSGFTIRDLTYLHHRDPDIVLDVFKGVTLARDLPESAAAVVSFPPLADSAEIRTIRDVARRTRERMRHGRAAVWSLYSGARRRPGKDQSQAVQEPAVARAAVADPVSGSTVETRPAHTAESLTPSAFRSSPVQRRKGVDWDRPARAIQDRFTRVVESGGPSQRSTWVRPSSVHQFGVPGAHGVNLFRGRAEVKGEANWRHGLPRLPIIGSAWIWPVLVMIAVGLIFGGLYSRTLWQDREVDPDTVIAAIDERIVAASKADSTADTIRQLDAAQDLIDEGRDRGLDDGALDRRQQAVTEQRDDATNVVRMSDVQRVGSLPDQFNRSTIQAVYTPVGIFFAAGSLYQWQVNSSTEAPSFIEVLKQGSLLDGKVVGQLYGVAFDAKGLYATDGQTVFMLDAEEQSWRAVTIELINDQPWQLSAVGAFGGAVYLLQPDGAQIYKFDIDSAEDTASPEDWLVTGARDQMQSATDMAIDGTIYVSLNEGDILPMYLGDFSEAITPPYMATTAKGGGTQRVLRGSATGYLFAVVIDGEDSRIVAFDGAGENAQQLKLPIGFTTQDANVSAPFTDVRDVVIDESSGTVYIINADGIWTARYSLPALPAEPPATPDAE